MNNWAYTDKVKKHFMNPLNVLSGNEKFESDGKGLTGNIKCGDEMMILIKVDKEKKVITGCKWKTYGCASAIASTSVLSEMVKGMPLGEAYRLSPNDIMKELGGLPDNKIHCSVLGDKALRAAIDDYYKRSGQEEKIKERAGHVICQCLNITDREIEKAIKEGAKTYPELQERIKIGTACGQCKEKASKLLADYLGRN